MKKIVSVKICSKSFEKKKIPFFWCFFLSGGDKKKLSSFVPFFCLSTRMVVVQGNKNTFYSILLKASLNLFAFIHRITTFWLFMRMDNLLFAWMKSCLSGVVISKRWDLAVLKLSAFLLLLLLKKKYCVVSTFFFLCIFFFALLNVPGDLNPLILTLVNRFL